MGGTYLYVFNWEPDSRPNAIHRLITSCSGPLQAGIWVFDRRMKRHAAPITMNVMHYK